mgnify:FL=1
MNRAMKRAMKKKEVDKHQQEVPYVMDFKRAQQHEKLVKMRDEALRIGFQAALNMVFDNAIKVKGISEKRAEEIVYNIKHEFDEMARKLGAS